MLFGCERLFDLDDASCVAEVRKFIAIISSRLQYLETFITNCREVLISIVVHYVTIEHSLSNAPKRRRH